MMMHQYLYKATLTPPIRFQKQGDQLTSVLLPQLLKSGLMRRMTFVGSDLIQILLQQHQYYNNTG
jgi:hypothetical protein